MGRLPCWVVCIFILHLLRIDGYPSPNGTESTDTDCPEMESINISSSKNSITLSWTPQSPNLISYYEIVYTYTQPCTAANIPPGVERFNGSLRQYTLDGLEEYSTYKLMHRTIYSEQSQDDDICAYIVNTIASAPVWPPSNLNVTDMTNTTIMISWEEVDCLHRNSNVTGYHVIYGQSSMFKLERNVSELIKGNVFTATDLIPGESYNFQVYSVNDQLMNGRISTTLVVVANFKNSSDPSYTSDMMTTTNEINTTSNSTESPEELNSRLHVIIILAFIIGFLIIILIIVIATTTIKKRRMRRVSKVSQTKSTQIEEVVEEEVVEEVELQQVNTTQTKIPLPLPIYQGMAMDKNSAYSSKTKQGSTALIKGSHSGDGEQAPSYRSISSQQNNSSEENKKSRTFKVVSPYAISPIVASRKLLSDS